MPRVPIKK